MLLSVTLGLFEERGYHAVRMADVAAAAGLAKGTVFLSFATKESLFLALLEELLGRWLHELEGLLHAEQSPSTARVGRVMAQSLRGHESLTRLLTILSTVLEHNVDIEEIVRFKGELLTRLATSGALLESKLAFLEAGEGARVLLHMDALVVGLRQLSDPGPQARQALTRPELSPLRVDFEEELERVLIHMLRGREHEARS